MKIANANFEHFDNIGNSYGMISVAIRNIAESLESEQLTVGDNNIFGETVTEESNAAEAKLSRERMADLMIKLAAKLRAA